MGRKRRLHYQGIIHHAMARGNHGDPIFLDQQDYDRFLALVADVKLEMPFKLYAYCLMPNHWHMLIKSLHKPLGKIVHLLLSRYTRYFNKRHELTGHVFQRRYHGIHCNRDSYLLGAMRYIHLNPVKAGLVEDPAAWKWSGHSERFGANNINGMNLLDYDLPLAIFSPDAERAEELYDKFMNERLSRKPGRPRGAPPWSRRGKKRAAPRPLGPSAALPS